MDVLSRCGAVQFQMTMSCLCLDPVTARFACGVPTTDNR